MLNSLSIKNYALIDNLSVSFSQGLTIITGETGAGKSILLGGLSLILGKRAEFGSVKDTSKKCVIEGVFDITTYSLKEFFKQAELDFDDMTILRREILPSGKSRAFVNDTPVNLQVLQDLGTRLLDIHSQHQTLQLTSDDFQFQLIDGLASNKELLKAYRTDLENHNELQKDLTALQLKKSELIKEYDYNSFLLNELSEASLGDIDIEALEEESHTLTNVELIQENLQNAHNILSSEEFGTSLTLKEAKMQLSKIASYTNQDNSIYERINSISIELDDIVAELEQRISSLDLDPSRLDEINTRLSGINNLFHKHQVSNLLDLKEIEAELTAKVMDSDHIDSKIELLEKQIKSIAEDLRSKAKQISENRHGILPDLKHQLVAVLSKLGMPNARFNIELKDTEDFQYNGMDLLDFKFSANKGGKFNDLKKAASGGELSRIMLSIKFIISKYIQLPTIIFDEIDTGVSGEISNKMADIMQDMSTSMQVFSITHLPQIAAKGDYHFKVYKKDVDNVTSTRLKSLNEDERVVEIASMLSGSQVSDSAIAHAKQLLN